MQCLEAMLLRGIVLKCMPFSNITIFKFYTSIIIHYTTYTTMHLSQARIQEFSSGGGGGVPFPKIFDKQKNKKNKKINK